MAKYLYGGENPNKRVTFVAGGAIVAGDMLTTSSTSMVAASDGSTVYGIAVDSVASGDTGVMICEDGILASFAGTIAVNAIAYAAGNASVDGGAQGNVPCGIVVKADPDAPTTRVIVKMRFGAVPAAHA